MNDVINIIIKEDVDLHTIQKEYTDKVNVTWVHKTIDALIALDKYPLLAPLRYTPDEEVLEIIHKHTHEPLQDANVEIRTNVINEISNQDWKRGMDVAIAQMKEFYEGERDTGTEDCEVHVVWAGQEEKACEVTIKCSCGESITKGYDVFDEEPIECYKCDSKYKVIWPGIKVVKMQHRE